MIGKTASGKACKTRVTRGMWLARGYALFQLIIGLYLLYLAAYTGYGTMELAKISGGLPSDTVANVAQRSVFVIGVAFQSLLALFFFAAGITSVFLASGMWRYREWARHATLVLAIVGVPVLAVSPLLNWVILTAAASNNELLKFVPTSVTIIGVFLCVATVYLFAYDAEIIALYLPRPNLIRGKGNKYIYAQTPIPKAFEQKLKRK